MKKIFEVAKWEFLEKVKTKAFIVSLILTPSIIIGFSIAPTLFSKQEQTSPKVIGFVDTSEIYFKGLEEELEKYQIRNNQPKYILINLSKDNPDFKTLKKEADSDIFSNKFEGYILVENGGTDSASVEYRTKNSGNSSDLKNFNEAFNKVRIENKLIAEGINTEVLNFITNKVEMKYVKIEKSGEENKSDFLTTFFTSFILMMLLFMMITLSGQMFVRSLVEEKSNRLIEILISSCSTDELLAGKILGLGSLGLFQVLIWSLVAVSLVGAAIIPYVVFNNIVPMLLYFLLGFIFYTSIFIGVGSVVSTEQEAQQATSYLSLLLLLPIILAVPSIENPNSPFIKILTYIPFTLPTAMILRQSISALPLITIAVTSLIMLISIYLTIKVSSKIFRIGILSYGKRPSIKEIFRWIKEEN